MKLFEDLEVGEEFEKDGYIWVKFSETDCALVWDADTNNWKIAKTTH